MVIRTIGSNVLEIELPDGVARQTVIEKMTQLAQHLGLEMTPHARGAGRSRRDRQQQKES